MKFLTYPAWLINRVEFSSDERAELWNTITLENAMRGYENTIIDLIYEITGEKLTLNDTFLLGDKNIDVLLELEDGFSVEFAPEAVERVRTVRDVVDLVLHSEADK